MSLECYSSEVSFHLLHLFTVSFPTQDTNCRSLVSSSLQIVTVKAGANQDHELQLHCLAQFQGSTTQMQVKIRL